MVDVAKKDEVVKKMEVGGSATVTAAFKDAMDADIKPREVRWSSVGDAVSIVPDDKDPAKATISAVAPGSVTVVATGIGENGGTVSVELSVHVLDKGHPAKGTVTFSAGAATEKPAHEEASHSTAQHAPAKK